MSTSSVPDTRASNDPAGTATLPVDPQTGELLRRFHFDRLTFERLRRRLREEGPQWANTTIGGRISSLAGGDVTTLPAAGSAAHARLAELGARAMRAGEVAGVVLAGGMATRFGGQIKAAVPVMRARSFLDLKVADFRRVAAQTRAPRLPVHLMASVATRSALEPLARALSSPAVPVACFNQCASLRLTPDGDVFRDDEGRPSLYATGHGDLVEALANARLLRAFADAGVKYLLVSNVDNLAASPDAAIVGAHVAGARPVTVEVVGRRPGDAGGAVLRVDHRPQIVESFRLPAGTGLDDTPIFNTNTFVLSVAALSAELPFDHHPVRKTVSGRPTIQFERLLGEITSVLPTHLLRVPRGGLEGRFVPIKEPGDLEARRPELGAMLRARGVLDQRPGE
ncbi:MAG TPA: UTP--glucose-1-phosphate uridylyltransferase [Polyangia bacterium]|nr:UTP--glucose-1-phosphate uridylyltransferase [Polyangia bacterium]